MAQIKTKKLGEILVEAGVITPENLDMALREQSQTGEKLGTIFQRLGICSEKDIAKMLASQAGVACVDLSQVQVDIGQLELVDRDYAEKFSLLPLQRKGSTLQVAMANPLDLAIIDELGGKTGKYIEVVHAPDSEIQDAIVRYYGAKTGSEDRITALIDKSQRALASGVKLGEGDSPFIRLVDQILRQGVEAGATDIHIEPEEKVLRCRYRVDGRLSQGPILPAELMAIVVTRLKIMAELNISESRVPQDGRILFDTGRRTVDLRVNTFPTVNGEGICCRILDKEALILGLEKLGMDQEMQTLFRRDLTRPNGIILVTGPTGSGKTTTLYSALTYLNKPDTKIITLEDPVEYELPVINQAQINTAKGFTFAKGLRAILRQDPDILLVGEIRDVETAQMAIRAALTGHLVFSTLHTNSAAGAIPRLLDMGVEPFLLSATLVSILAQRLVRRVCDQCAVEVPFEPTDLEMLGLPEDFGDQAINNVGKGCNLCRGTGFRGRMAVFEYLRVDKRIRRLIAEGADGGVIEQAAREAGRRSLFDDALSKMKAGRTAISEVMRVAQ
ncbi:type II secretion system protein GspE [bacterium DOLJORAL78_65_58]|nr:MAG: type II secretion system protein GspE [bacterium DOLZORAL124_64_63]PIE76383.1 MAG: type II secretion system protein GspE [bacterium DOLJORAL78_65_58]